MGIEFKLTGHELLLAAQGGSLRQVENIKKKRQNRYGCGDADSWSSHIEGVIGEMVLSRFLNVYWAGKGKFRDKDVGGQQVRCAQPGGALLLHPADADDDVFWLIRGTGDTYTVEGWILAKEGKQERWWEPKGRGKNGRPAFFVPVEALHDPEASVSEVQREGELQ